MKKLNIVIFSKDRACQLDSLLRSMRDNVSLPVEKISVIYKATSEDFEKAYGIVQKREILSSINWVKEVSFRDDVIDVVDAIGDDELVMFLVDDDIFLRRFDNEEVIDAFTSRHLFITIRASRTYEDDVPPEFTIDEGYLEWKWNYHKKKMVTWNYPFSVDGNIIHSKVIKKIVHGINFKAPNSFESSMHKYRHKWWIKRIRKGLATASAVVVNNPLNKVQTEGETWHGDTDIQEINEQYLAGNEIDNTVLYSSTPTAIHYAIDIKYIPIQ